MKEPPLEKSSPRCPSPDNTRQDVVGSYSDLVAAAATAAVISVVQQTFNAH